MYNKYLYNNPYHKEDISKNSFLITGGAGFIGSNLVEYLLKYNAGKVRVLDNLSNGYYENIKDFIELPNFEFINGDICDLETCKEAVRDIDFISHQAALGSVPRSIANPIITNEVNVGGFLNMLYAAKESNSLKRFNSPKCILVVKRLKDLRRQSLEKILIMRTSSIPKNKRSMIIRLIDY